MPTAPMGTRRTLQYTAEELKYAKLKNARLGGGVGGGIAAPGSYGAALASIRSRQTEPAGTAAARAKGYLPPKGIESQVTAYNTRVLGQGAAGGALGGYGGAYGGSYGGVAGTTTSGTDRPLWEEASEQMRTQQEEAKAANLERYQDILKLYEGVGVQERKDIKQEQRERLATHGQEMVSRGLAGTSAPWAGQALITREARAAKGRLATNVALLKGGVMERRTDAYPDYRMTTGLLGPYGQVTGAGGLPAEGAQPAMPGQIPSVGRAPSYGAPSYKVPISGRVGGAAGGGGYVGAGAYGGGPGVLGGGAVGGQQGRGALIEPGAGGRPSYDEASAAARSARVMAGKGSRQATGGGFGGRARGTAGQYGSPGENLSDEELAQARRMYERLKQGAPEGKVVPWQVFLESWQPGSYRPEGYGGMGG